MSKPIVKTGASVAVINADLLPAPPKSLLPSSGVIQRADRIMAFHEGGRRSAAQQVVYAYLAGCELIAAKDETGHGGFMKWCEANVPNLSHATVNRYTKLAAVLQSRLSLGTSLNDRCLQLTSGDVNADEVKAVFEAIQSATDGKTITELYRAHGLLAEPIHQSERAQPDKRTPEQIADDRRTQHLGFMGNISHDLETFLADPAIAADLNTNELKNFRDTILNASKFLKDILAARGKTKLHRNPKPQKAAKSAKKGGK